MTNLLDMLKEAELRIGFTNAFRTVTDHENLSRTTLRERLLLCLNGLGTNTGLKRMAAGQTDVVYKDLLHVRRRFITREICSIRHTRRWSNSARRCAPRFSAAICTAWTCGGRCTKA
jgi:hypothetical protein